MIASHGTASAADQIAAFTDGFALGTILYNVAAGFRLIGRAGEMAAAKAGISGAETSTISGAVREAEVAPRVIAQRSAGFAGASEDRAALEAGLKRELEEDVQQVRLTG